MKFIFIALLCLLASPLSASSPPHTREQLCELAVIPKFNLNYKFGIVTRGGKIVIDYGEDPAKQISEVQAKLKRQPDDISSWLLLGDLQSKTNESILSYQQAERLCRQRLASSPQSALTLVLLSEALCGLGKLDEAESHCRQAIKFAPNESQCWCGLGKVFNAKSWQSLSLNKLMTSLLQADKNQVEQLLKNRPKAEAVQEAITLNAEAKKYFDKAVEIAPQDPEAHLQRATYEMVFALENHFIRFFRDGSMFDTKKPISHYMFTKNSIPDLKEASRLSPRNGEYIALAALFEYFTDFASNSNHEKTSDDTNRSILNAITQLEKLTQDKSTKTAVTLRSLGLLKYVYGMTKNDGPEAAEACFRQAVAMDSADEGSWNLLLGCVVASGSSEKIMEICERRLKAANTAYNHLLVAKAATKQKNWGRAYREAGVAYSMQATNVVATLMLAALSIRQGEKEEFLKRAELYLRATREQIQIMAIDDERNERLAELMLNAALFKALTGKINDAHDLVDTVLKYDPENKDAQEIKRALPDS